MHIPDGFLDAKVWAAADVVAIGVVGACARKVKGNLGERQAPLLGVTAAFVFAAQMVNFPVAGGTSGHFVGGALIAILLGPAAGVIVMTCVLLLQCFIFADGGLLALGANILNMGIVGSFLGYGVFAFMPRVHLWGLRRMWAGKGSLAVAAFAAGWFSVVGAACLCALELGLSGRYPLWGAMAAMGSVHALIGVGEGIITAMVLNFLARVRPELIAGFDAGGGAE
jgi:cobalt/nickel transport system permease protein